MPIDESKPHPLNTGDATLIDLSSFLADAGNFPKAAPTTVDNYRVGCRRLFDPDTVDPATRIADLDIDQLAEALASANPQLKPATVRIYVKSARLAIKALRDRRTPPILTHGTVEHLPAFLADARTRGKLQHRTATNDISAIRRLLRDMPDLAGQYITALDLDQVAKRFTTLNPALKETTIRAYLARFQHTITVYTASSTGVNAPSPPPRDSAPAPRSTPGAATTRATAGEHLAIPLPGGRAVSLRTPPDLTVEESAATGALLRLYHPAMFAPTAPPVPSEQRAWTLVFWPESAPEEPEAAHLTGPSFRCALADYIRTRCPDLADEPDESAIDTWFDGEVFVALAFDGHHEAHNAGTLL